ncbi:hypothetical protein ACR3H8_19990 [Pseudomonas aeruginosa]|uniref:hypothetical protein n=1 Tax=Pseudomonas aeruginosa group TaxID=136841 RepID=UPI00066C1235|nr:hypothetical protein [Pseudomonas aeruginosa]EIU2716126.1 hypothetical protein [Pseudomonas aeruginosa]EIU2863583.1 hypothetical protein [Pseudomonas aeruginosa]ELD5772794.1 hypothetical protein [Pseudomonas aeruginosa]MBA5210130.1 hypothetical protein [Pseudomonas aeruginosa]MBG3917533.1 hypothetical protein [Pseudomonas aeruginosa]
MTSMLCPSAAKVVGFIDELGLLAGIEPNVSGWAGPCRIVEGKLLASPECPASTLLHELAHIAIVPSRYRYLLNDNISIGVRRAFELAAPLMDDPDSAFSRAMINMGDCEATAWAWAAGTHLGITPEQIIQDEEYDHGGQDIRLALKFNSYLGINGLAHAGFCCVRTSKHFTKQKPAFPKLAFWLQK